MESLRVSYNNCFLFLLLLYIYFSLTAKVAMEKLGLKIDKYYASEIDKDAMSIAKAYHGESIVHLERVEDISLEKVKKLFMLLLFFITKLKIVKLICKSNLDKLI